MFAYRTEADALGALWYASVDMSKSTATIRVVEAGTGGVFSTAATPQPIRDETLAATKAAVSKVRKRLGAYSSYGKIDAAAKRPLGWAKEQLRKNAQRWSFSVAVGILTALHDCEISRAKAVPLKTEAERFEHQARLRTIDNALAALFVEQTPASKRGAHDKWTVRGVAMYYDTEAAPYIAETFARIMDNLDLLSGPRETRMETASKALAAFLSAERTTIDSRGLSRPFRDACESAFWGTRGRFDAVSSSQIDDAIHSRSQQRDKNGKE
jgi:hypothetical protein